VQECTVGGLATTYSMISTSRLWKDGVPHGVPHATPWHSCRLGTAASHRHTTSLHL
jgi:hypothetical protein